MKIVLDISASTGSKNAKQGYANEKKIVLLMNDKQHLSNYKSNQPTDIIFSLITDEILKKNKIQKKDILNISASDTIPKLHSGGSAKTDVFIEIKTLTGIIIETFSIKTTSGKTVTCHEYKHTAFASVLNCQNTQLERYLELFQQHGGYKNFNSNLPNGMSEADFENLLLPHQQKFCEWVLTGQHDINNLKFPNKQVSTFIFIDHKDGNFTCKQMSVYIKKLLSDKLKYSVPFTWTVPSGGLGKRIQLKVRAYNYWSTD
jgi:hypothetical protein